MMAQASQTVGFGRWHPNSFDCDTSLARVTLFRKNVFFNGSVPDQRARREAEDGWGRWIAPQSGAVQLENVAQHVYTVTDRSEIDARPDHGDTESDDTVFILSQ